jgi:hypothetical protein
VWASHTRSKSISVSDFFIARTALSEYRRCLDWDPADLGNDSLPDAVAPNPAVDTVGDLELSFSTTSRQIRCVGLGMWFASLRKSCDTSTP